MRLDMKQATIEDAEAICKVAVQEQVRGKLEHVRKWAELNISEGPAYTGRYNGSLVFVGGIRLRGDVGQIWAVFAPEIDNCKKETLRSIRDMLTFLIDVHNIRVLVATCQPGFKKADTFLRHLGFRKTAETFQGEMVYTRDLYGA